MSASDLTDMRHTLEMRTIAAIKNTTRRGFALIRARYVKAMQAMGYSYEQALRCYEDVWDVAQLEKRAAEL